MTDELKLLSEIQGLDARILSARTQLDRIPKDLERLEAVRAGHLSALNGVKAKREAGAKNRRALELEVEAHNAGIRKLQSQQAQVKTNREYTAMLHEIDGAKQAISGLEEKILIEMENGDVLAAAERDAQKTFDAENARIIKEQERLNGAAAELQAAVDHLSAGRDRAAAGLPKEILSVYQRIFQGRGGKAIVPVENQACGGCGAPLPLQLVNEVRKMETLITCETCGRILVWSRETISRQAR
ncbi:MAG: C4-type zinc ribbon domain-containing protein [Candidatus Edwardsbacteria bacterium]|nr:C4-type zinc ribbon domain-containing protein [Candidatus Edwardsbacteria bacterium]